MATLGKFLLVGGALLIVIGALVLLADRLGLHHLPGTLTWRRGDVTVFVPLGLMIVASIVLTLGLNLLFRR
jgi:hypothetical protein